MLKHGEVNPLNVFGLRRLSFCPPHFTKVPFANYVDAKIITDWIFENMTGRFCLIDDYQETPGEARIVPNKCAAFEEPGEASMFILMLDTINPKREFSF